MKTHLITLFLAMLGASLFAQNDSVPKKTDSNKEKSEIKTLFGSGKSQGAYVGFTMNYGLIDKQEALSLGGRLMWVVDHGMGLGFGGYGFANNIYMENVVNNHGYNLVGGYGGVFIEPIVAPKSPIHVSFPMLFGVGGVAYNSDYTWNSSGNNWDYYTEDASAFLVGEPGVELELNMVRFIRLSLGVSYRYTLGLNLVNTKKDVLNGLSGGMTLKLGKF